MLANEIITFGCRLNAFESERIARAAAAAGLEGAVIVNTCAVTAEAERQARQAIRRARRLHPEARIIVTGCAAEITPDRYAAMSEVDCVLGNEAKLRAESYGRIEPRAAARAEETPAGADSVSVRARAAVQVQQGCDHRCTFCVIPYAAGGGHRRDAAAGSQRVPRDRADRGRSDRLWRRSGGAPEPRRVGAPGSGPGSRTAALAAVVARSGRDRRRAVGSGCARAAADAASAFVAAGRRRSHSQAHETAPFTRSGNRGGRSGAHPAAGNGARRRPDRRLPDRDRGHVSPQP